MSAGRRAGVHSEGQVADWSGITYVILGIDMPGMCPVGNEVEGMGGSRLIHWRLRIVVHIISINSGTGIRKAAPRHCQVVGGLPVGR